MSVPARFAELVDEFAALTPPDRLQLLVELGEDLPDPPEALHGRAQLFERVTECQTPLSVLADVEGDGVVHLYFSAPPHGPVTRGFAGVLHAALDGAPAADVLALPAAAPSLLGLDGVVSPLRLRGFAALLGRVQRQVAVGSGS